MELLSDHAWQWRPKATVTAADTCDRCTVLALQYSDCAVLRVRWNDRSPSRLAAQSREPEEPVERDVELHGHAERVVSVKIYGKDPAGITICSASRDCVMVWRLTGRSRVTQSILVENLPDDSGWVTFDDTGTLVAVASDRDVKVFVIERKEVLVTLEGHLARVTRGEFHPIHHHLLLTASEDRTFKIWDLAARTLWFQSSVLSAFSILSIALNPVNGDAAFGFADGSVKVFKLLDGYAKELTAFNVENFVRKSLRKSQETEEEERRELPQIISSLPPWARSEKAQTPSAGVCTNTGYGSVDDVAPSNDEKEINTEVSCPVLSMKYVHANQTSSAPKPELQFNGHADRELLDHKQFLVVGVPGYLLSVNAHSFKIEIFHDFQNSIEGSFGARHSLDPVCVAKDFCFYHPPQSSTLQCGVMSAFQPCFTMLGAAISAGSVSSSNTGNQAAETNISVDWRSSPCQNQYSSDDNNEWVSVIPRGPPPKDSVLNMPPLSAKKTPPKGAKNLDKPVTFNTRIKSSGYGSATSPFGTRQTPPKSRTKARKSIAESRANGASSSSLVGTYLKEYPTHCGLLQHYQPKHALPPKTLHNGTILHIEYSSDAKWLATSGNDRVAQVCKLPFSRFGGEGNVFVGHEQAVRAIHWSHNDRMLVTVASDKTSRLWLPDSDTSSLTLQGIAPPSNIAVAAAAMGTLSSAKKATRQEVVEARFFYMDKFLLSACGNLARLHQFELDEAYARASSSKLKTKKKNDVEVLENQSRKKRVAQWSFDDMQSVTSLACVNGAFLSSVAVIAGSDRSIRVLDVGAGGGGRTVRVMRDAHSRPAHTVELPRPTSYTSHPSNFYDLLLSSAPDNTIHLWDIRADNCVMKFCEHINRVHTLGCAFSPCMRYVATGSEDRAAYIYDIRTGRRLVKLKGHTDVVTSVAFSPIYPQLATASCDGTVRFYSSEKPQN